MNIVNMVCDLLDCSFICVEPVCLYSEPCSRQAITSSTLSHSSSDAPITTEKS